AGLIVAGVASPLIAEALRDPLLRECMATGKLTFDKPISESTAKAIHDQCRAELARRDVLARSTPSFSLSVIGRLGVTAARLIDPIHDVIALACGLQADQCVILHASAITYTTRIPTVTKTQSIFF